MKAIIACEYSRIVSEAFEKKGWNVTSCDILPADKEGNHYQGNVLDIINNGFDLMIAFPPCTYLTVAANRHVPNNHERWQKMVDALKFVHELLTADIKHIGLENPVGVISTFIRKPDQIIHPYYFGDNIPKKTCLWLKTFHR
jgi:site-specific DNA-cytosine methylase